MAENKALPTYRWFLKRTNNTEEMVEVVPGLEFTVGRNKGMSFVSRSLYVSRIHCKFKAEGRHLTVLDMNSGNGTYVNNKIIPPDVKYVLEASDMVGIGAYDSINEDCLLFKVVATTLDECSTGKHVSDFESQSGVKCEETVSRILEIKEPAQCSNAKIENITLGGADETVSVSGKEPNLSSKAHESLMISSVVRRDISSQLPEVHVNSSSFRSSLEHSSSQLVNLDKIKRMKIKSESENLKSEQLEELWSVNRFEKLVKEKRAKKKEVKINFVNKRKKKVATGCEIKKPKLCESEGCSGKLTDMSAYKTRVLLNDFPNEFVKDKPSIIADCAKIDLNCVSGMVCDILQKKQQSYMVDDTALVISDNKDNEKLTLQVSDNVDDSDDDIFLKSVSPECGEWEESDEEDKSWFLRLSQSQLEESAKERQYVKKFAKTDDGICDSNNVDINLQLIHREETTVGTSQKNYMKTTSVPSSFSSEKTDSYPCSSGSSLKLSHLKHFSHHPPSVSTSKLQNGKHKQETIPPLETSNCNSSSATGSNSIKIDEIVEKHLRGMKHDRKTLMCDPLHLKSNLLSQYSDKGKSASSKYDRLLRGDYDLKKVKTSQTSGSCIEETKLEKKQNVEQKNEGNMTKDKKDYQKKVKVRVVLRDTALGRSDTAGKSNQQNRNTTDTVVKTGTSTKFEDNPMDPSIRKLQDPLSKKKRVRFAPDGLLVECRYFPVEWGNKLLHLGAKDAPLLKRNFTPSEGAFHSALKIICNWKFSWLAEQNGQLLPPPCYGPKSVVYPMLTSFANFEEYKQVLMPLMLLNLWASVSEDSKRSGWHHIQNIVFDSLEPSCDSMMKLHCHLLLTEKALKNEDHPFVGDLCQLDIRFADAVVKSPVTQNMSEDCWVHLFAYVESNSKESYFGQKHHEVSEQPVKKLNVVLRIRHVMFREIVQLRLKVLTNIRCEMRAFEAVEKLRNNKLCERVLKPTIDNYRLPQVDLNSEVAWQNHLNCTQKFAVLTGATVCGGSEPGLYLIQGPPGTGKSRVIISTIMQILFNYKEKLKKSEKVQKPLILLCAPSNAAVDELVERLLKIRQSLPRERRFKLVRTGRSASMRESIRCLSLPELSKNSLQQRLSQNKEVLESIRLEVDNLQARKNSYQLLLEDASSRGLATEQYGKKLVDVIKKLEDLRSINQRPVAVTREQHLDMEKEILSKADIIATTLGSCCNAQMAEVFISGNVKNRLTCCIIDEASQCLEPQNLVPLMFGLNKMILVGDPEQLPGTVHSRLAKEKSYGQSLLTRLCNKFFVEENKPYILLNVQYRMHEEICRWPNAFMYQDQLSTGPGVDRSCPLKPYVILGEDFSQSGEVNDKEAHLVCEISGMVKRLLPENSVGIIAPYQKQRHAIKSCLKRRSYDENVMVNTIDGFQGQECDVIILSCTRTTGVGFLNDSNRLNVALTRARKSLIICGNFVSLQADHMWKNLLQDAKERGLYFHVNEKCLTSDHLYKLLLK